MSYFVMSGLHPPESSAAVSGKAGLSPGLGRAWLPWFREIFDAGRDLPPGRPAALLLALASGKADGLSGCFFEPQADLDVNVRAAAEVEKRKSIPCRSAACESGLAQKSPRAIRCKGGGIRSIHYWSSFRVHAPDGAQRSSRPPRSSCPTPCATAGSSRPCARSRLPLRTGEMTDRLNQVSETRRLRRSALVS